MWYDRDNKGRFLPLQKPPKQLTDKEKKLIENFEKGKKMKRDDWRWKNEEQGVLICRCGYSEFISQEVDEFMCDFCEDYHSLDDMKNESKSTDEDGLL